MMELGVYELSIGDTIGVANVGQVDSLFRKLKKVVPTKNLRLIFMILVGKPWLIF